MRMTVDELKTHLRRLARSPEFWIVLASAAVYVWLVVPYWKPTWDSATYITLARSLVSGKGYTYMDFPHIKYPPGFPLLLAPIVLLFGKNFLLMRLLIAASAVASIGMTHRLFRRIASPGVAIAVALMTAACYALLFEATRILSDVPYMFVSLLALYFGARLREDFTRRHLLIAVGLIVAAFSVRIIGFVIAPALALVLLIDMRDAPFRERLKSAGVVLGVMLVVMGIWFGRNAIAKDKVPPNLRETLTYERELIIANPSDPHSRTVDWEAFRARVQRNADYYTKLLARLVTAKRADDLMTGRVIVVWLVIGWLLALVWRRSIVEYYSLFYAVIYLTWTSLQGERFLVPALPMIFYYALMPLLSAAHFGAVVARDRLADRGATEPLAIGAERITAGILLFVVTATVLWWSRPHVLAQIRAERRRPYYQGAMAEYIDAFLWVRDNTPDDAVIITNRAPYGVLLADRKTFTVPWVSNAQEILDSIERNGGTHVIANAYSNYLNPVIKSHPDRFREVHRIGSNVIYAFVRSGTESERASE